VPIVLGSAPIISLMVPEAQLQDDGARLVPANESALARLLSLRNLAALSLVHCVLFTGLMLFAFVLGHPQPVTFVFGFTHGVLYIVMSVAVGVAAKLRTVSPTTAIVVIVLGAAGPYFGAFDLVREERRRRREPADAVARV
jgi:hypothetical protein